jgi:hypothetical protein
MSTVFLWTIVLHFACFVALFVAWFAIAGQSGSPVPDNWPVLARILDILGTAGLATTLALAATPVAAYAAFRNSSWTVAYPVLLLLHCAGTVALCLMEFTHMPARPAFVASPRQPCWRFGRDLPAVDAVGTPVQSGDLVVIRSAPDAHGPLPDTPEQAAQREAWNGHIVLVDGTLQGGALRFRPTGADLARKAPRFCLWPDNVVRLRLH